MVRLRLLPWEYGIRNLMRRPARTCLTLLGLTTVVLLVLTVVSFIRGLEASLAASGDPKIVLVYSIGAAEDIENSSIAASTPELLCASLAGIQRRYGAAYVSPEIYVATQITIQSSGREAMAVLRGVTPSAPWVRRRMQLTDGHWPSAGEMLAGRLAAAKLGCAEAELAIGSMITVDGKAWRISGHFSAGGAAFESELWAPLDGLQQTLKRQDLSLVALGLAPGATAADVQLFCKGRSDLELQALAEDRYYALLQAHYRPVRTLGWVVVALVGGAGVFVGLNTMYGAVVGRVRELAALQTIGFRRLAIAASLVQEATLLSTTGALLAAILAITLVQGAAMRFTMSAIALKVDGVALLVGCGVGLALGLIGALPPALKAMRLSVAEGLKAV